MANPDKALEVEGGIILDDSAGLFSSGVAPDYSAPDGSLHLAPTAKYLRRDGAWVIDEWPNVINGFTNRDDVSLSFADGTRTLTVEPSGTSFVVWADGARFEKTSADTVVFTDTDGLHIAYYDGSGVLQHTTTFDSGIILTHAIVAAGYWNATDGTLIPNLLNETHGTGMSPEVHYQLHLTVGTRYASGLDLSATTTGSGSADADCQFANTAGLMFDEDVPHTLVAKGLTDTFRVLYRTGSVWSMGAASSFPVLAGANGRALWNDENGGSWQTVEAGSGDFVLAHVYALPGASHASGGVQVIMGQATYGALRDARVGALTEVSSLLLSGLPVPEFRLIATFIVETKSTFSNTPKSRFVQTDTGADYIDWRRVDPLTLSTAAVLLS